MRNLAWAIIVAGAASAVAQVPPGGGGAGGAGGAGGVPGAGQVPPRTPPPAAGKGQGVVKREQTPPKGAGAGVAPSGIRMKGTAPIPPANETPEQRRARLLREARFGTTQPGAQPGADAPGTTTNPTVQSRSNQIMSFDANGDGRLSQAELTVARFSPIFTQADANSDGFVTSAELSQLFTANPNLLRDPIWLDRSKAGRAAMKNLTAGARSGPDFVSNFMTYDADGDGRLQRSEITAPALGALFTRVDANADGVVSTAELQTYYNDHAKGLPGQLPQVPPAEGAANGIPNPGIGDALPPGLLQRLTEGGVTGAINALMAFDANGDGQVARQEISDPALATVFTRIDANADGFINNGEMTTFFSSPDLQTGTTAGAGASPFGSTRPGQIFGTDVLNQLNLTAPQQARLQTLQQLVDSRLQQILSAEQLQTLQQIASPTQPSTGDRPPGDFSFKTSPTGGLPPIGGQNVSPSGGSTTGSGTNQNPPRGGLGGSAASGSSGS